MNRNQLIIICQWHSKIEYDYKDSIIFQVTLPEFQINFLLILNSSMIYNMFFRASEASSRY